MSINIPLFSLVLLIIGSLVLVGIVSPAFLAAKTSYLLDLIVTDMGWFYLISVFCIVVYLFALALSKWGSTKLGAPDEKPEFSTISWFCMLFAAGMGIGLVFFGVAEPVSHYFNPPFGQGGTAEAVSHAIRSSFFHWGFSAWAVYAIVGLSMAYFGFARKRPFLVGTTLEPLCGEKRWIMSLVDLLSVLATFVGVASSFGMGVMQIAQGLHYSFNIPVSNTIYISLIVLFTIIFVACTATGIEKGIKILSDFNLLLAAVLMLFIFVVVNPRFVLNLFTAGVGDYLQNFIKMSFWTDPAGDGTWVKAWTVFYWAWWISWAPFVGSFFARISRGRTIREFVLGVVLAPALLCAVWFSIFGGSALYLQHNGLVELQPLMANDMSSVIFGVLDKLPCSTLLAVVVVVLLAIFFITSANSATFVSAMFLSRGSENPPVWVRVILGVMLGALALILLLSGGLESLQGAAVVGSLPFMFCMLAVMVSLYRALSNDHRRVDQK